MSDRRTSEKNRKHPWLPWVFLLLALCLILAGIHAASRTGTGSGEKEIRLTVTDSTGTEQDYTWHTDAGYLSEVLDELQEETDFSYTWIDSTYGRYITAVNGETADYEQDGAYWAIYVNGTYGQYSVDTQPVQDGDVFALQYEKAQ